VKGGRVRDSGGDWDSKEEPVSKCLSIWYICLSVRKHGCNHSISKRGFCHNQIQILNWGQISGSSVFIRKKASELLQSKGALFLALKLESQAGIVCPVVKTMVTVHTKLEPGSLLSLSHCLQRGSKPWAEQPQPSFLWAHFLRHSQMGIVALQRPQSAVKKSSVGQMGECAGLGGGLFTH
jgi:hypothetical protein